MKKEKPQIDVLLESCKPERYHEDVRFLQEMYEGIE